MGSAYRRLAMGLTFVVATVAVATGVDAVRDGQAAQMPAAAMERPATLTDTTPSALSTAFRVATHRAQPAVVYIEVKTQPKVVRHGANPFRGTPFEDMFGNATPDPRPREGSGSGFIFRPDGYILTNNHVVDGADEVTVVLKDRRQFSAKVVGRDPNTDIAVVKIDAKDLPVVQFGNSDAMEVGDWVVALGYPLRLGPTATAGIVSAKGRSIGILDRSDEASAPLEHFIQTDAAINPGNSGGPLVDLNGRVVGVNSAIASPTGYYSGYGFAIPIALAQRVASDLIQYGEARRPRLGVGIRDVQPADAEVYHLDKPAGAAVVQVTAGSPADKAGIELGDVIMAVNGKPVATGGDLMELLARMDPGDMAKLDVIRYGERKQFDIRLGTFEPAISTSHDNQSESPHGASLLGFEAADLTPAMANEYRLDTDRGVVITDVDSSSPAALVGVRPGLRIEQVNGKQVKSAEDVRRVTSGLEAGQVVSLIVVTPDGTRTILNYRTAE